MFYLEGYVETRVHCALVGDKRSGVTAGIVYEVRAVEFNVHLKGDNAIRTF